MSNDERNERLKVARERLGLTRKELAEKVGISLSTYSMVERGERTLTPSHIKTITDMTEICREWIENGTGPILRKDKDQILYDLIMSLDETDKNMMIRMIRRLANHEED